MGIASIVSFASIASFASKKLVIGYTSRKPSTGTIRVFTRAIARFEKKKNDIDYVIGHDRYENNNIINRKVLYKSVLIFIKSRVSFSPTL